MEPKYSTDEQIMPAIKREIDHAENTYSDDHAEMGLGDWLIVIEGEMQEAKFALADGDRTLSRAELTQIAATAVNAMRYLGVIERCTRCNGVGGVAPGAYCPECSGGYFDVDDEI